MGTRQSHTLKSRVRILLPLLGLKNRAKAVQDTILEAVERNLVKYHYG